MSDDASKTQDASTVATVIRPDQSPSSIQESDQQSDERNQSYYTASSWQLVGRKFWRHKVAVISVIVLAMLYLATIFAGFFTPYAPAVRDTGSIFQSVTKVHIYHEGRLQLPFVYGWDSSINPVTLGRVHVPDFSRRYPVRLFVRRYEYDLLGFIPSNVHLFGVDAPGVIYLFGTDSLGRDMFSRALYGARISLSIGLVGVAISFTLGCLFGGVSGYFGGPLDMIIQRIIEFLQSLPTLPLWMALAASVPLHWPAIRVYFMITVILSLVAWTGLARVIRGKLLQLRVEDYVMAATIAGAGELSIIRRHLLPGFMSYLIVHITLAIPGMILAETALSFLGIGLRPPVISWGVMLREAQNIRTVALHPWLLLPALYVVGTVFLFNFVGDGLRDAADPYK